MCSLQWGACNTEVWIRGSKDYSNRHTEAQMLQELQILLSHSMPLVSSVSKQNTETVSPNMPFECILPLFGVQC
jgi:hypothetical protein